MLRKGYTPYAVALCLLVLGTQINAGTKKIWTFGDSNTQGWRSNYDTLTSSCLASASQHYNYRDYLKVLLREVYPNDVIQMVGTLKGLNQTGFTGYGDWHSGYSGMDTKSFAQPNIATIYNALVNGTSSPGVKIGYVSHVERVPAQGYPDVVVIMFGTNDPHSTETECSQLKDRINQIAKYIGDFHTSKGQPKPLVVIGNILPLQGTPVYNSHNNLYRTKYAPMLLKANGGYADIVADEFGAIASRLSRYPGDCDIFGCNAKYLFMNRECSDSWHYNHFGYQSIALEFSESIGEFVRSGKCSYGEKIARTYDWTTAPTAALTCSQFTDVLKNYCPGGMQAVNSALLLKE